MKDEGRRNATDKRVKIGVFDSGVGAYLVAAAIQRKIPDVALIVKTDPEFFPYGNKSQRIIQERLIHFAKEFQKEGCQIVVIACNSATTNGIEYLRWKFPELLLVGIEPPVKPIVAMSKTGKVAVIGTEATMRSKQLERLIERYGEGVKIEMIACPGLAEFIEENEGSDLAERSDPSDLIKQLLDRPISDGVDVVGLACTHYPYLLPLMKKLYPAVTFYDPTEAVIKRVKHLVS